MNTQIASAADQQVLVAETINQNVVAITARATETQEVSDNIQVATDKLSVLSDNLLRLVSGFKY